MKQLEPIEVPWRPKDALIVFVLSWIGLPLLIVIGVRELASYVPFLHQFLNDFRAGNITASFIFAVADALCGLGLVWYYLRRYHASWRDVGWRKFNVLKTIGYFVAALIVFILAVNLAFFIISWLFPTFNAAQPQTNEFTQASGNSAGRQLGLIALVLLPPIVEETVFRGFIFPALSKRGGVVVGAVLTSLLFGLAHLQYNVSIYTLVLSLILCFMYYRLRSIWPGIFLHMINNYIAYMALMKK